MSVHKLEQLSESIQSEITSDLRHQPAADQISARLTLLEGHNSCLLKSPIQILSFCVF